MLTREVTSLYQCIIIKWGWHSFTPINLHTLLLSLERTKISHSNTKKLNTNQLRYLFYICSRFLNKKWFGKYWNFSDKNHILAKNSLLIGLMQSPGQTSSSEKSSATSLLALKRAIFKRENEESGNRGIREPKNQGTVEPRNQRILIIEYLFIFYVFSPISQFLNWGIREPGNWGTGESGDWGKYENVNKYSIIRIPWFPDSPIPRFPDSPFPF